MSRPKSDPGPLLFESRQRNSRPAQIDQAGLRKVRPIGVSSSSQHLEYYPQAGKI
jgi:hypothetical protein